MKIKVLLCNCKGMCDSFKSADMNTLPFQIESDLEVQYAVLHPQLCGQGGNQVLTDALRTADADTWVVCGACAPAAQAQLFRKLLRATAFPAERFVAVDVRGTDNPGILARLGQAVRAVVAGAPAPTPGAGTGAAADAGRVSV